MAVRIYNAAELKADLYARIPGDGEYELLMGDTAQGDIPISLWQYAASSTASDNFEDGVIQPTLQTGNGRWLRRWQLLQPDWDQTDSDAQDFLKNKPTVPQAASQSAVTPALDTPTTIHATRNCLVNYCVSISVTSTLLGTNSGEVFLEISPDGSTGWVTIGKAGASIAGVASTIINTYMIPGEVPAGYYYRLRTAQAGTNGATFNSLAGQEVLI